MPTDTISVAVDNDDGSGYMQKASWPPSAGTWADTTSGNIWVSKVFGASVYTQDLAFVRFDTSTIADTAVISAATLQLYMVSRTQGSAGANNYSLVGDYYDFGGEPTVSGDWIETSSPSIFTAVDLDTFTLSAVNNITLTNFSGINLTGYTGIRLTLSSGTPTTDNWVEIADREAANQEPRLQVTYTTAGASEAFMASARRTPRRRMIQRI